MTSRNEFNTLYGNLTTFGRKTGKPHTVELTYFYNDGELYFLAHKKENGSSTDWYHNLQSNPACKFEVDGKVYTAKAISFDENKELENEVRRAFEEKSGKAHYASWYKNTARIPVVIQIEK